jgi:hypothetical protein
MVGAHPAFAQEAHGVSVFDWLLEGALLVWRFSWDEPGPPSATGVIGRDDSETDCSMLYADERGVTRVYRMSLEAGVWRMWRTVPGFAQRMTGRFSDDGAAISVRGELSRDGETWEQDLDVDYRREAG